MPDGWCYRFVKLRSCATLPDHHRHHRQHTEKAWRTRHMGLPARSTLHCTLRVVVARPSVSYCIVYGGDSRGVSGKRNTKTPTNSAVSLRRMRCLLRGYQVRLPLLSTILRMSVAHGRHGLRLDLGQDSSCSPIKRHRGLLERTGFDILISS